MGKAWSRLREWRTAQNKVMQDRLADYLDQSNSDIPLPPLMGEQEKGSLHPCYGERFQGDAVPSEGGGWRPTTDRAVLVPADVVGPADVEVTGLPPDLLLDVVAEWKIALS